MDCQGSPSPLGLNSLSVCSPCLPPSPAVHPQWQEGGSGREADHRWEDGGAPRGLLKSRDPGFVPGHPSAAGLLSRAGQHVPQPHAPVLSFLYIQEPTALWKGVQAKSVGPGKNCSPSRRFIWWVPESSTHHCGILTFNDPGGCVFSHTCREEPGSPVCVPLRLMPVPCPGRWASCDSSALGIDQLAALCCGPFCSLSPLYLLPALAAVLQGPSGYCSVLPSWDPSQGDFTASHSRWTAPGLTAVPSVCHRWNPGSSWGSRVSPQLGRPSADRELQLPLENDWVSCFNRISLFRGFLSGLKFF